MKRKRNPERADRENPAWTKEAFSRARKAREVLPEIFGKQAAAKMLKPRGRPKTGHARTSISPASAAGYLGSLEGDRPRLATPYGRNVKEGSLRRLQPSGRQFW